MAVSLLLVICQPIRSAQAQARAFNRLLLPQQQEAYALIEAINALRVETGKIPYEVSPILMSTAQGQAGYMASIGHITHLGPGGITTTNRLLAAGYPLAGDLSLGGIRSENVVGGAGMTVDEAINYWRGDDTHYNTMTSPNYTQIGAGIAASGEDVYYVIDCARHIGATTPYLTNTPAPTIEGDDSGQNQGTNDSGYVDLFGEGPLATSLSTATPDSGGKLYHTVKPGETLWLIAISYGVKIVDVRQLNGLSENEAIYPKEKLLIRQGIVVTPIPPTPSKPPIATLTSSPMQIPSPSATISPTDPSITETPKSTMVGTGLFVIVAVLIAGTTLGFRQMDEKSGPSENQPHI